MLLADDVQHGNQGSAQSIKKMDKIAINWAKNSTLNKSESKRRSCYAVSKKVQ